MARSSSAEREARLARERLKRFSARQTVHERGVRRRRRDNVLAVVGVIAVAVLAGLSQATYFGIGPGAPEPAPSIDPSATAAPPEGSNIGDVPDPSLAEGRQWTGTLTLNDVELGISLDGALAPQAVAAFVQEVADDYFPGKTCHRLTDSSVRLIQCGSLDGTGMGDPDFSFGPVENAPADGIYAAGTIAMARASGDAYSNGRQFFIMLADGALPNDTAGGYTVFGTVTSGLDRLITEIADHGVEGDADDGAPVVTTVITAVAIQ